MRKSLSLWLLGIILLTLICFEAVFKPITFEPRKDPSDASRYLRPVGYAGAFDPAALPRTGTFTVFNKFVYVYIPQSDLRLGLDLRGGMRVVLSIPEQIHLEYPMRKSVAGLEERGKLRTAMLAKLAESSAFGADAKNPQKTYIDVQEKIAVVTFTPSAQIVGDAKDKLQTVNTTMTSIFGADSVSPVQESVALDPAKLDKQATENQKNVMNIMETRLNLTGTSEVTAYAEGKDRVVLEIPGVKDPDKVMDLLGGTAQLEFVLIPKYIHLTVDDTTSPAMVMADKDGVPIQGSTDQITEQVVLESTPVIKGDDLDPNGFTSTIDTKTGKPAIGFAIKTAKQQDFGAVTASHKEYQLAILIDNKFVMAPTIQATITDRGIITGNFTMDQATQYANKFKAGALPVPVDVAEKRTVSATLGADSISKSMLAGIIGFAAVLIFMAAYYRLPGLMANLALIVYLALSLAVLKLFNATLTLPGIAGIIISVGMAVDANVIIFERLKEELRSQKPLESAIDVAFSRAWTAILDSNIASLITGTVLYAMGSGAVKGFAITLLIGVAVSLFTAVTVTRLFMKLMIRSRAGHNLAWYGV